MQLGIYVCSKAPDATAQLFDELGTAHLRHYDIADREIPVVILSGSIDEKGQERVRVLGAEAVLSKPLVPRGALQGARNGPLRAA